MKAGTAANVPGDAVAAGVPTLSPPGSVTGYQMDGNVTCINGMRDSLQTLEVALSCN